MPYRLDYHGRWTIEFDEVDRHWTKAVRSVLAVSPNNPTGSMLSHGRSCVSCRCAGAARDAALIVDEVFADYPLRRPDERTDAAAVSPCLTFRLGGLSKSAGLPQVKLGWIAVDGPDAARGRGARAARADLRHLPVGVDARCRLPRRDLIAAGAPVRARRFSTRVRANYAALAVGGACASVGRSPARRRRLVGGPPRAVDAQRGGPRRRSARARRRARASRDSSSTSRAKRSSSSACCRRPRRSRTACAG